MNTFSTAPTRPRTSLGVTSGTSVERMKTLIESAPDEAWHVLNDNRDILDHLVLELLEKETLGQAELAEIFKDVRRRPVRPTWLSSESRLLSDQPPVLTPAEKAALEQQESMQQAIDHAAQVGATGVQVDSPAVKVIEVPETERLNPDA